MFYELVMKEKEKKERERPLLKRSSQQKRRAPEMGSPRAQACDRRF